MSKQPDAFVPSQGGSYRPAPVQVSQTYEAPASYGLPLLSISHTPEGNFCTLSKPLLARLPQLLAGQPVHVVVPFKRGGEWYLDTNPKPGAGVLLPRTPRPSTYFRIPPVAKVHFMRSGAAVGQGRAGRGANVLVPLLRFVLGPEVAGHPGHYQLLRQA